MNKKSVITSGTESAYEVPTHFAVEKRNGTVVMIPLSIFHLADDSRLSLIPYKKWMKAERATSQQWNTASAIIDKANRESFSSGGGSGSLSFSPVWKKNGKAEETMEHVKGRFTFKQSGIIATLVNWKRSQRNGEILAMDLKTLKTVISSVDKKFIHRVMDENKIPFILPLSKCPIDNLMAHASVTKGVKVTQCVESAINAISSVLRKEREEKAQESSKRKASQSPPIGMVNGKRQGKAAPNEQKAAKPLIDA